MTEIKSVVGRNQLGQMKSFPFYIFLPKRVPTVIMYTCTYVVQYMICLHICVEMYIQFIHCKLGCCCTVVGRSAGSNARVQIQSYAILIAHFYSKL